MVVSSAFAQTRTIKGRVIADSDGEPLVGASVFEKGSTTNGVVADLNGNFTIAIPSNGTLVISYIGFQTQNVKPLENNIIVKLKDDAAILDDIVVIGYGVQKKSDLTGAIASIKADDIKNLSATDAASVLQGKAAGIQIINSGSPGAGSGIRVRGYTSNSGNEAHLEPLLIVDGVEVDNIQYLDPSLIENIEVLKDGASAAIYGVRAANGVVLITTKKGSDKGGAPSVTYSFKAINQSLGKKAEIFNAADYIEYHKYLGHLTDASLKAMNYNGQDTDWYDEVFDNSWAYQHNITVQGGNQKGHFMGSLGIVDNDGIVKGDKDVYKRLSFQLNADYKVSKWLTVSSDNNVEKWSRVAVGNGYQSFLNSVVSIDPLTAPYVYSQDDMGMNMKSQWNSDPVTHGNVMTPPNYTEENPVWYGTSKIIEDATANPLAMRDRVNSKSEGITLRGHMSAVLTPIGGLSITSRLGYRIGQSNSHSQSKPFWLSSMAFSNDNSISAATNAYLMYQWENFVNYNKTFAEKHNFGIMVGMSFKKTHKDNTSLSSKDTKEILSGEGSELFNYIDGLNDNGRSHLQGSNLPEDLSQLSYLGRLSYNYAERYYLQFNWRSDGCDLSKLSKTARWGSFPSVSAGWTISKEEFFRNTFDEELFSFLKIRGSWGRNGNNAILDGYRWSADLNIGGYYHFHPSVGSSDVTMGAGSDILPNPDLKWETTEQFDLGLDARLLNDRLSIGIDWYRKNTNDLLVELKPYPELGYNKTTVNSGSVLNTGIDFEIGWRDRINKDFSYSVNANFGTLYNEVLGVNEKYDRIKETGINGFNNHLQPTFEKGHTIWYFRGYEYAGVDPETGKAQYYDKNGKITNAPTEEDKKDLGSAIPKFTYGITVNLKWKDFDFTVFGTGAAGNKIYNLMVSADRAQLNGLNVYWKDSWRQAGDNAKYPDMKTVATDWTFYSSSAAVFNGSFFKFKQIQLGYTVPRQYTRKAFISDLRFSVSLDDFFTITSYPGADPETSSLNGGVSRGFDNGNYPMSKKVVFGVNLSF